MAVLGLLAFFTCPAIAQEQELQKSKVLTFEQLLANPNAFKTATVTFRGQFHKLSGVFSPFFTLYTPSGYLNFSAWEFSAPLWKKEVFKADFPFLYISKGNRSLCEKVSNMKPFVRFEAIGVVESTFNDIPWIQVKVMKELPLGLNKGTIRHMAKGYAFKAKDNHLNAAIEFSKAYAKDLPEHVRILIRKEEGKSLYVVGSYPEAVDAFEDVIDWMGREKDTEVEFLLKEAVAMIDFQDDHEEMDPEELEEFELPVPDEDPIIIDPVENT
jgi:hypothetical protein